MKTVNNNMIKYSAIIPTYNTKEEYFIACLESCKMQDYKNVEFIIIDDASPNPEIKKIANNFVEQDKRFRYLNLETNIGVAGARNVGVGMANGDWIVFIDADDYIASDYFSSIDQSLNYNLDLLIMGYYEDCGKKKKIAIDNVMEFNHSDMENFQFAILTGKSINASIDFANINVCSPWARVYRKEVLKKTVPPIGIKKEQDGVLSFELYEFINKCKVISYAGYFYRINQVSTCRKYTENIEEILENTMLAYKERIDKYKGTNENFIFAYNIKWINIIGDICLMKYLHNNNKESWKKRKKFFKNYISSINIRERIDYVIENKEKYGRIMNKNLKIKIWLLKHRLVLLYFYAFEVFKKVKNPLHFS